jgi:hypothetical protein
MEHEFRLGVREEPGRVFLAREVIVATTRNERVDTVSAEPLDEV